MVTDPISDMLTRIRNAIAIGKMKVEMPYSRLKFAIALILKEQGYIHDLVETGEIIRSIQLTLKYGDKKNPAIRSLRRVSTPGRRVYLRAEDLPTVLNGYGIAILSTSQGVMTNKQARTKHLGGEILCEVY